MSISRDVISRAMAGNRNAITKIYNETYKEVYRVIKPVIGDEAVTLNLIKMTYIRAFKHMDHLKNPDNLNAWLKRVAKDTARKWIEKHAESYAKLTARLEEEGITEDTADKPSKTVLKAVLAKCAVEDDTFDEDEEENAISGIVKKLPKFSLGDMDTDEKVGPVPKKFIPIIGAVIVGILVLAIVAKVLGGGSDAKKKANKAETETVVQTESKAPQKETERVLDTSATKASDFFGSYKDSKDYVLEIKESDEGFLMARIGSEQDGYYDVYYYDYWIEGGKLYAVCDAGTDEFMKFSDGSVEAHITSNHYDSTYSPAGSSTSGSERSGVTVDQAADESSNEENGAAQADVPEETTAEAVEGNVQEAQPVQENNEE